MYMDTVLHPFSHTLLEWYRCHGRILPWRSTTDPYAVWVSEVILQQTRIQQGWAYWERFMQHWPKVELLAAATEDEVLREWQGLGYYSRARNLHHAAQQIVAMGGFPRTPEGLRSLCGVGDYTAAAIGSIAFGLPMAAVDGNVFRVLSRHFGIMTAINTTEGKKVFTALAQELLPPSEASAFNQAMMDFGALQCVPKSPDCGACPLQETCVAFREGTTATLPVKLRKTKMQERHFDYYYIRCHGETAICRRGGGDIWQGLWQPFLVEEGTFVPTGGVLRLLRKGVRHVLTHRIVMADFWLWTIDEKPSLPEGYVWVDENELDGYAVPRLVEMMMDEVRKADAESAGG